MELLIEKLPKTRRTDEADNENLWKDANDMLLELDTPNCHTRTDELEKR